MHLLKFGQICRQCVQDAERQLLESRVGLEGLVGTASGLQTLQTLKDLLAAVSGTWPMQLDVFFPLYTLPFVHS